MNAECSEWVLKFALKSRVVLSQTKLFLLSAGRSPISPFSIISLPAGAPAITVKAAIDLVPI